MNALQLRIGRTLLAASQCGQQTIDFTEETKIGANDRAAKFRKYESGFCVMGKAVVGIL